MGIVRKLAEAVLEIVEVDPAVAIPKIALIWAEWYKNPTPSQEELAQSLLDDAGDFTPAARAAVRRAVTMVRFRQRMPVLPPNDREELVQALLQDIHELMVVRPLTYKSFRETLAMVREDTG